ncbi:MAG: hypothetical protein NTW21_26715 [Verrucomicrobia bacterium]|nr:hypothetical protein [Verrucomicrobiota bacterium]
MKIAHATMEPAGSVCTARRVFVLLFAALSAAATDARATVAVNSLYTSNMVIQRDQPFPVWGTAAANKAITVTYNKQSNSTTADAQGNWQVTLPAMSAKPAGSDFTISEAGGNTITQGNVVVGDVWLCSGQSNMAWSLSACNRQTDVDSANFPGMRQFLVGGANLGEPSKDLSGSWVVCSPGTAYGFSAAAFYFGRKIYQDQNANIPLGLIVSSVGGTRIDPWLAPEGCTDIPVLAPLYSQPISNYGPFSLFNGMIYPLAPYPMKGAIWYQGENSETTVQSADSYFLKMKGLQQGWKRLLGMNDFAFYLVQIANFGAESGGNPTPGLFSGGWDADTRLQQANAMSLPHAGMASAIDIGNPYDYHPTDKLDVGERLALWALKNDYGRTTLVTSGPILNGISVAGNKAICSFDYVGSGLMVGSKTPYQPTQEVVGGSLALFSIAGSDGTWYWANAAIVGNTVEMSSPSVSSPQKIAYACWQNPLGLNLYNRDGLPASPFHVDDVTAKYTITASAGSDGNISPAGTTTFIKRKTALYTITPNAGYYIQDVQVDGASIGSVKYYTFDPLYANHTITATFANTPPAYSVTAAAGAGGSVSPVGTVNGVQGGTQTFAIAPNSGLLSSLRVDGQPMGSRHSFTFADLNHNHTLAASFRGTINASAGTGGTISPDGAVAVPYGGTQAFAITVSTRFTLTHVIVDGVSQGPITSYTFTNVTTNHTILAVIAPIPYIITASAGDHGSISPSGTAEVVAGNDQAFTFAPSSGYMVDTVRVDGVSVGRTNSYTFTNVQANHTISVAFKVLVAYTITATAGPNGSISPAGTVEILQGWSQTFTIEPMLGFAITSVSVDGVAQGAITSHTFSNVGASHTISATFSSIICTISASAGTGGTISPSGTTSLTYGQSQTYTITPNSGYVANVVVDGVAKGSITTYTFTNLVANHVISVTFSQIVSYTIYASAGTGGTITPSGVVKVRSGSNQTFTITANSGFAIANLLADSVSVGKVTSYTFTNVQSTHNLAASFLAYPFGSWIATYYPTPGDPRAALYADPDGDGHNNLEEFAFHGNPADPANRGAFFTTTKDHGAGTAKALTFTCAVRRSTTVNFPPTGVQRATIDGVTYTIQGSPTLTGSWDSPVSYLGKSNAPPAGSGLPELTGTAWEYRTFSAFSGLPDQGFLRARVEETATLQSRPNATNQ